MKKAIIISALLLAARYGYAQSADGPVITNKAKCMADPDMPKNATPAWPESAYTPVGDPSCAPCYQYTNKRGLAIMECPFLVFPSQGNVTLLGGASTVTANITNDITVETSNSHTGNYPTYSKNMYPPHTTPVWPKSTYTPTGNPNCAPCYEYKTRKGTEVMECPYLTFDADNGK